VTDPIEADSSWVGCEASGRFLVDRYILTVMRLKRRVQKGLGRVTEGLKYELS
jgi:hypothetical protein